MPATEKVYGYMRVSTKEQNEDRQLMALVKNGVPPENIYSDKQSGKDFQRPQYKVLIAKMKRNDLLCIKSIDRLGRNYSEILEQWRYLTKEKGIYIRVLDMPILDTGLNRDLTATLISDIVLQLLSYVAEYERENIRKRQKEGIEAAKARGVQFGKKKMTLPNNYEKAYEYYISGHLSVRKAAEMAGMKKSTFYRYALEKTEKEKCPKK